MENDLALKLRPPFTLSSLLSLALSFPRSCLLASLTEGKWRWLRNCTPL